jgi:4'-phosphopantetheinyl transferase
MEKIFYTTQREYPTSLDAVRRILSAVYGIDNARIARTETGKPYLVDTPLFFSIAHTDGKIFIAFSSANVGVDAERQDRETDYMKILKRFPETERAEIHSHADFIRHWTAKESAVKWLGGTLANDLRALRYERGKLFHKDLPLPVKLWFTEIDGVCLAVCSERDFSKVTPIIIP